MKQRIYERTALVAKASSQLCDCNMEGGQGRAEGGWGWGGSEYVPEVTLGLQTKQEASDFHQVMYQIIAKID